MVKQVWGATHRPGVNARTDLAAAGGRAGVPVSIYIMCLEVKVPSFEARGTRPRPKPRDREIHTKRLK
ncbi:hypothetical protein E2C01_059755 [Portunus trituberculatus]|uniref:Uncharacterized protein n=1 Tax=Portunus trituberculatus TaxID=210409 RepID=A0A5B7H8P4_PORTR|nr:hypothetical protein [Portunus trituberculatus]